MQPIAIATGGLLVVGLKIKTTNRIEALAENARIPALWRRFFAERVADEIPDRLPDPEIIAVYCDYERDDRGPYSFLIGHQVRSLDQVPRGMAAVRIPPGRCLRFSVSGAMPDDLAHTWDEIGRFFALSHEYERAWTADFEIHRHDDTEMYVAVRQAVVPPA